MSEPENNKNGSFQFDDEVDSILDVIHRQRQKEAEEEKARQQAAAAANTSAAPTTPTAHAQPASPRPAAVNPAPQQPAKSASEKSASEKSASEKPASSAVPHTAPARSPAPEQHTNTRSITRANTRVIDFDDIDPENARLRKQKQRKRTVKSGQAAAAGLLKTVVYLAFVAAISAFLAINIIHIANDIFAFVKNGEEITVVIPENADTEQVAEILHDGGLIDYPKAFTLYTERKLKNSEVLTGDYIAGIYTLSPTMNYDKFISALSLYSVKTRETVRVTIPEGLTVDETIDLLIENGVGDREKYIDAINNYEYDYRFVKELEEHGYSSDRRYRLEGYLFPDTYDFFTDESEISVIDKMLQNFNIKFEELYYERAVEMGKTVDDVIVIASIIEKEARYTQDLEYIASVFYNRLDRSGYYYSVLDAGYSVKFFDSDATIVYALGEHRKLTSEDLKIDSPYNTYTHEGLTPGAISNPGLEAIVAALYPEDTNYYFFFSLKNGETVYSKTYNEHVNKLNQAKAEGTF